MQQKYDFIIAGGGLAGLSLVCHMVRSGLRDRSILIIDREAKKRNDRTWGFWSDRPTLFDTAVYRAWRRLHIAGEGMTKDMDLGDYAYKVIRGDDFYDFAHQTLAAFDNVHFMTGDIERIEDGRKAAQVIVDGRTYKATWVFDSLPPRVPVDTEYQYLRMHFRGWEIETPAPAFDPTAVTFLDFRTPQVKEMRFFYILPFDDNRALVEFTVFSKAVLHRSDYEEALCSYLSDMLHIPEYRVVSEERGAVPITDDPLVRNLGRRVMGIGARAGRIKPSTGYAFMRVQKDSDEIVESLLLYGHPFEVPDDPDLYDILDAVMLKVMHQNGAHIQQAFGAMFKRNPIELVLRFLDEEATPWDNLMLVTSMPPQLFLKAFVQVATQENLFEIMKG